MSIQLPSLHVAGTHATDELDLDLSQTRAVYAEPDESFLILDARGAFVTAKAEFHPAIAEYVGLHYAKMGDDLWVNPTGVHNLTHIDGRGTLYYGGGGAVLLKSFRPAQVAALIRRAGLVEAGHGVFVAVEQVVAYDLTAERQGQGVGYSFFVLDEFQSNLLNLMEASDWLKHKDGSWSNPDQVRMLKGETIVYTPHYSLHIDELTPEALAVVSALPWVRADEGTLLNLNQVKIIGPPAPDDSSIVVCLGAGVEYAISREANAKIVASLIGFMPPHA